MPSFGPGEARCEVLTSSEGLLSVVAPDLLFEVTSFEIAVDPGAPAVSARFDAASLRARAALRGGRPVPGGLKAADARSAEAKARDEVLAAARFPEIRFASTAVTPRDGGGFDVRGELTLAGVTRDLAFRVDRRGDRLVAEVTVRQPEFGIRPATAMLGAIRVRPGVLVRAEIPAAAIASGAGAR